MSFVIHGAWSLPPDEPEGLASQPITLAPNSPHAFQKVKHTSASRLSVLQASSFARLLPQGCEARRPRRYYLTELQYFADKDEAKARDQARSGRGCLVHMKFRCLQDAFAVFRMFCGRFLL